VTATNAPAPPSRLGRIVATLIVMGLVGMWGYVVYLAFGPGRADPPDQLDDPGFAIAAEARCDRALDAIAELQPASQAPNATARADTLDAANAHLVDLLADLEAIRPNGEDGVIVGRWLVDWHTYVEDREAYAARLRDDEDARLLVSKKGRNQVTDYIDEFTKDNAMPACSTPSDAG
jgi:hypothetical protein